MKAIILYVAGSTMISTALGLIAGAPIGLITEGIALLIAAIAVSS